MAASSSGYPGAYALGSFHTARAAATATAFGALVGSVTSFGAMFEGAIRRAACDGASALCFGLDGALLASASPPELRYLAASQALGAKLLLGGGSDPSLRSFLQVRGMYAVIHMGIDILRGCSSPYGTIGNVSHLSGFVGGFCYIVLALPELGNTEALIN
eukprot:s1732_g9.t1